MALGNFPISKRKQKTPARIRVLVFGAFDIFHPGHRSFFRQAKKHGHELIVAVGRDHIVSAIKGRRPKNLEHHRLQRIASEPLVDQALLAPRDPRRRFAFIKKVRPHVIGLGHDQVQYTENLETDLRRRGIIAHVIRLRPFRRKQYRSSLLRQPNRKK